MSPSQKKKNKTSSGPVKNKFFLTGFLDILLLFINFTVVALLFFADSACWVSPVKFLLPAYFGLAFPVIALLAIAFLIFWLARLKWSFLISLVALGISYRNVYDTFPLSVKKETSENAIKVLSYNVHLFNFYTPLSKNKIMDYIAGSDADILCLQEFGYNSAPQKDYLKKSEILEKLQKKYPYHHIDLTQIKKNNSYGVAIFSKFPILQKGRVNYVSRYNSTIYADMQIGGKIVRVFNCHLESNQLTENDRILLKNLGEEYKSDKINDVVEHLSQKLGHSFRLRAKQVDMIAGEIAKTDHPVILCGDFNDVPVSYAYATIKGNRLHDSFCESGKGYGYTFNENLFWFRIDYIMHSKELHASNFLVDKVKYSDHFPVACYLEFD